MPQHLSFSLVPKDPFSLRYFVVHSGVALAYAELEQACTQLIKDPSLFRLFYIHGPRGSGKTHLAYGFESFMLEQSFPRTHIQVYDLQPLPDSSLVSEIVAEYERIKRDGGLLVITSQSDPHDITKNPHLQSRLLAGNIAALGSPTEDELKPLLLSLLERRNLILNEKSLEYLLRRLPVDPLSFDNIFARLDELSLTEGRSPGPKMLRELISK